MRTIIITGQYKNDLKLARKRHLPEDKLNEIILKLANDEELPSANRDHPLTGEFAGTRECHIQPDWLLIKSKGWRQHCCRHPLLSIWLLAILALDVLLVFGNLALANVGKTVVLVVLTVVETNTLTILRHTHRYAKVDEPVA